MFLGLVRLCDGVVHVKLITYPNSASRLTRPKTAVSKLSIGRELGRSHLRLGATVRLKLRLQDAAGLAHLGDVRKRALQGLGDLDVAGHGA